jgi:glycerophosphoryl diester phosphodiesterase
VWRRGDQQPHPGLVVAHRAGTGLSEGDPIAGVRRVVELGVPMVEFDVRSTSDHVLVVHHDARSGAMRIADQTYGELQRVGLAPPLLSDVLAAAEGRIALDVELKESGYERAVIDTVLQHAASDRVVLTSFDDETVGNLVRERAGVGVGLILGRIAGLITPWLIAQDVFPFRRFEACGADFLVPSRALLAAGLARRAARRGVGILIWDVNDPRAAQRLLASPDVLGVVTDSPTLLANVQPQPEGLGNRKPPK